MTQVIYNYGVHKREVYPADIPGRTAISYGHLKHFLVCRKELIGFAFNGIELIIEA